MGNSREKYINKKLPILLKLEVFEYGAIDGARTHDNRDHNPGLYQLSYNRHKDFIIRIASGKWRAWQDSNLRPPA